jgi:hypothetical protein
VPKIRNYDVEIMDKYRFTVDEYKGELNRQVKANNERSMLSKSQDNLFWKNETKRQNELYAKELYDERMKKEIEKQTFLKENRKIVENKRNKTFVN